MTLRDGRQTVEEIKDDFDVDTTSREEVLGWLRNNGFDPIGVSLNGDANEASGATTAAVAPAPSMTTPTPPPIKKLSSRTPQKITPVLF